MPSSRRSVERDRRLPVAPLLLVLVVLIVVSAVISLAIGSEPLPLRGVLDTVGARVTGQPGPDPTIDVIVWDLRAPRGSAGGHRWRRSCPGRKWHADLGAEPAG